MNRGIALVLFMFPTVVLAQGFFATLINTLPLTTTCDGEVPLPDGVPVQVWHDPDQDGIGVLDELLGVFVINGVEQGLGAGMFIMTVSGSLPPNPYYLLKICIPNHDWAWYSEYLTMQPGYQEIFFDSLMYCNDENENGCSPDFSAFLAANPPEIIWDGASPWEHIYWVEVQLTNAGNSPLEILEILWESEDLWVNLELGELSPGQSTTLQVQFSESATLVNDTLQVTYDQLSSPLLIPVYFRMAVFSVETQPPSIDFGEVLLGDTRRRSVTLSNTGELIAYFYPNVLVNPDTEGVDFDVLPDQLAPGEDIMVEATFTPQAERLHEAWISIGYDMPNPTTETIHVIGNGYTTDYNGLETSIPDRYCLYANYPNPFNPATSIPFALPVTGHVELNIYDITGREIATLLDETLTAGNHTVIFDGSSHSSGIYFARLTSGSFSASRKMILLK